MSDKAQEMLSRLLDTLAASTNQAADDVLLEALALGAPSEQQYVFETLLKRKTDYGLSGVVGMYERLPEPIQHLFLAEIKIFHHALRECGRSSNPQLRIMAMKLIALGRQGKLAYVLSENLHEPDESLSRTAVASLVAMARWVALETRWLQAGKYQGENGEPRMEHGASAPTPEPSASVQLLPSLDRVYRDLTDNRSEIEAAIARALDLHRGRHGQELLRAALLLCDWPGSKTLAILHTTKHGGQSPMVRRLQQKPEAEHVPAFLLGATHGQLRSHFGIAFSHIDEAPVLDALLRKTHLLKDHQLQLCMHQVSRGAWWDDAELSHDISRRQPVDSAKIAEWLAVSGLHDVMQDERMARLREHAKDDFSARLRLFRIAARRKRGSSVRLIALFLTDSDERLVRMAAREIVRRKPPEFENLLLQLMTGASESVRKIISRSVGQVGFEHFWARFDRLPKPTRKQAGKAMLKIFPDGVSRLARKLTSGPLDERIKAMQIAHELGLAEGMRIILTHLCTDANPKLRSKAIHVLGQISTVTPGVLVERLINDSDPRVRANAIEVLESQNRTDFIPVLALRARATHARERANAIKALHRMKVSTASSQLLNMLRDDRSDHKISALWALRQIGWWQLLNEVVKLAKEDGNMKVRRYALNVLKNAAEVAGAAARGKAAG